MSLEERIARLERTNHCWRWLALALASVLSLTLSCQPQGGVPASAPAGATPAGQVAANTIHEKLRARSLEVVDERGQTLGLLDCPAAGRVSLQLSASQGPGVTLGADEQEGFALIHNPEVLGMLNRYGLIISHTDFRTQRQAKQNLDKERRGEKLSLEDLEPVGRGSVRIGIGETGGGTVYVHNALGKQVVSVQSSKTNEGLVTVHDVNGNLKNALRVP